MRAAIDFETQLLRRLHAEPSRGSIDHCSGGHSHLRHDRLISERHLLLRVNETLCNGVPPPNISESYDLSGHVTAEDFAREVRFDSSGGDQPGRGRSGAHNR